MKLDQVSLNRGAKSIQCLPFNNYFYSEVMRVGLDSKFVYQNSFLFWNRSMPWFRSEYSTENSFRRMIRIGVMRRAVDGQGLTSKIRLTPLGQRILEQWPTLLMTKPALHDFFCNWFSLNNPFV